ncbi:MAG: hypothetical protein JWM88_1385 [Verrucomicrobia bacterium]|nr:hypothetical protein [Verrucomicrobiota bacterium]
MSCRSLFLRSLVGGACLGTALRVVAQNPPPGDAALQTIIEQNQQLQQQVRAQQKTIDELNARMEEIRRASDRHERELRGLQERAAAAPERPPPVERDRDHEVRIGAEAAVSFFSTGSAGQFPKSEFRVDDTRITLEAPVWKRVYFYAELNVLTREANVQGVQFGELYVEFEDVGAAWGQPKSLNLRAGSINTPFGEEYAVRNPMSNPLISHSLSDIWGPDEGIEIYGTLGVVRYAVAVQNGGISQLRDFNADKTLAVRIGLDPSTWLHLSVSAMRTGELATVSPVTTVGDNLSSIWFANAFFRALGPASRTTHFTADLYEGDAVVSWKGGQFRAALGEVRFGDNDPLLDNSRRLKYGFVEGTQSITEQLYAAARYSEIRAPGGYPLAGWGNAGTYFYRPSFTEELRRASLGFGYRFGPPLVLKLEYTWESGRMLNGAPRNHEDFFGAQLGMKF